MVCHVLDDHGCDDRMIVCCSSVKLQDGVASAKLSSMTKFESMLDSVPSRDAIRVLQVRI